MLNLFFIEAFLLEKLSPISHRKTESFFPLSEVFVMDKEKTADGNESRIFFNWLGSLLNVIFLKNNSAIHRFLLFSAVRGKNRMAERLEKIGRSCRNFPYPS